MESEESSNVDKEKDREGNKCMEWSVKVNACPNTQNNELERKNDILNIHYDTHSIVLHNAWIQA